MLTPELARGEVGGESCSSFQSLKSCPFLSVTTWRRFYGNVISGNQPSITPKHILLKLTVEGLGANIIALHCVRVMSPGTLSKDTSYIQSQVTVQISSSILSKTARVNSWVVLFPPMSLVLVLLRNNE